MTAEFAVALPGVLACLVLCVAGVVTVARQLHLVDAAATAARLVSRGEQIPGEIVGGATGLSIEAADGLLCVRLTEPVMLAGAARTGFEVTARACSLDERSAP